MSAGKLTPQEAAEMAVAERGIGHGGDDYTAVVWAIQLYEASRKRVQLTPEQVKAFEERVDKLHIETSNYASVIAERVDGFPAVDMKTAHFDGTLSPWHFDAEALRQLAAICEALADNLERFPS